MAYWPDRVREACRSNRSLAIAHGLAVPEDPLAAGPRGRKRPSEPEQLP